MGGEGSVALDCSLPYPKCLTLWGNRVIALTIQLDQLAGTGSITVLLLSSTRVDAPLIRLNVEPTSENGLQRKSQIMVDKPMTVKRESGRGLRVVS
jgi:hypothetical protein